MTGLNKSNIKELVVWIEQNRGNININQDNERELIKFTITGDALISIHFYKSFVWIWDAKVEFHLEYKDDFTALDLFDVCKFEYRTNAIFAENMRQRIIMRSL